MSIFIKALNLIQSAKDMKDLKAAIKEAEHAAINEPQIAGVLIKSINLKRRKLNDIR